MSPAVQDRRALASEEMPEAPLTGPFGGIQSELPPTEIEDLGFSDCRNFLLRFGRADVRPGYSPLPDLPAPSNEAFLGIADFYTSAGAHVQCVMTQTRLLQYVGGAWVVITGPGFTGTATDLFVWDILNYKLCFSQGVDKLFIWDGISPNYSQVATAPPCSVIAEVGNHLLVVDPANPQTYLWSGIADPTDWTSFSSGSNNLVNNLGPIRNILKLGQYGSGLHEQGIVQIIPTGIGLSPFAFIPIINATQGTIAKFSLDHYDDQGVEYAVYLGLDNVYVFNGSSVTPIGDAPMQGSRKRVGARSRILADVKSGGNVDVIYGFITYSVNGIACRCYWLVIPNVSVWVYNFDEGNWVVLTYTGTISTVGVFYAAAGITISELVGTIQAQSWTPDTLDGNNPFPGFLIGFNNGVGGYVDFTQPSEQAASITSGKLIFGDRRHKHTIKWFRLAIFDRGATTYSITLTNEIGVTQTQSFTLGTGSGDVLTYVLPFSITGLRFVWQLNIAAGQLGSVVEFAPMYDTSGSQRSGSVDNN